MAAARCEVDDKLAEVAGQGSGDGPEAQLARLVLLEPDASREDYLDPETGEWDVEGLHEDLAVAREAAVRRAAARRASGARRG